MNFATDPNYPVSGNPWSASPTRIAPSAGYLAAGFTPATQIPAQYLNHIIGTLSDAVNALTLNVARVEQSFFCGLNNASTASGAKFAHITTFTTVGFITFGGTDVQVPEAGTYLVEASGRFAVATATDPSLINLSIALTSGSYLASSAGWRPNANTSDPVGIYVRAAPVTISNPGTERIFLENNSAGNVTPALQQCTLSVRRIG